VLAGVLLVLIAGSACVGTGEPVPRALREYLDALRRKDYRTAYDLTQFPEILHSLGPGASLSYSHFAAFFSKSPLRRYVVSHVVRLDRRSEETPQQPGTPFFEVDVDLTYPNGTHRETFNVEGEVVGRLTVEPDRVLLSPGRALSSVKVDDVQTNLARAQGGSPVYSILLMNGRHTLVVGASIVDIQTTPLRVLKGSARVVRKPGTFPVVAFD
jgi:hypothetical protein